MSINIGDASISSFPQQGTIDWVQLGNTGVTATVAVLSRISAAHIDPFTLTVAQAVAGQYKLSHDGKAKLNECLRSLNSYASLDSVLWFGFGRKHIVRILAGTTQGMSTIAICGSLSEVLSVDVVASVLDELPATYGAPMDLRPSLLQWAALVTSCSGVISSTNFGLVAEHFISLDGGEPMIPRWSATESYAKESPGVAIRDCGQPKDVASALHAIGRLSSGSLIAIELRGGAICGVLAAIGLWFYGLGIEIRKGCNVVYRSLPDDEPVQILVMYAAANNESDFLETQMASQSSHICNISSIFSEVSINDNYLISGRVPWEKAIQMTFGAVGQELLKARFHFSQILGNGARMFAAAAKSEPNDLWVDRSRYGCQYEVFGSVVVHNENSYGKGLIQFMMARLPELATLDKHLMEKCLEYPLEKAREEYEAAMYRMIMLCDCTMCNKPEDPNDFERYKTFCIPMLAEFLLITLRNLTILHPDTDLSPYRSGLEGLYVTKEGPYPRVSERSTVVRESSTMIRGIMDEMDMNQVYRTAEAIYTGRPTQTENWGVIPKSEDIPPVFSARGVTFYLDILREFSDRPETAATLHVVPGNIVLESGRTYSNARDSPRVGGVKYQASHYQPLSSLPSPADTSSAELAGRLTVRETVGELYLDFRFTRAGKPLCSVGATNLVKILATISFSVYCPRHRCRKIETPLTSIFTVDGEGMIDPKADVESGRLVVIRRLQGNLIARYVALTQLAAFVDSQWEVVADDPEDKPWRSYPNVLRYENVIWKRDECWSCCIRAAMRHSKRRKSILPVVYIL